MLNNLHAVLMDLLSTSARKGAGVAKWGHHFKIQMRMYSAVPVETCTFVGNWDSATY
jgi:hypothetical protein